MNITLTYNLKKEDAAKPPDYFSEYDSEGTIDAIIRALKNRGHNVKAIDAAHPQVYSYFRKSSTDMVFNIAEGTRGRLRESRLPAMLECLKIPYTGSDFFSLALAMDKALAKKVLKAENIPTPRFQLFIKGDENLSPDLKFPLIVKPNCEGSSKGINISSVVNDKEALFEKIKDIINIYGQPALAEEFIDGRELTVGILDNIKTTILPVLEIDFSSCRNSGEYFYTWRMKEYQGNAGLGLTPAFHCPARLSSKMEAQVKGVALRAHYSLGCSDISRIDIRLSRDNTPYVLEVNPLPGLNPLESNFPIMAYAAGMTYDDLIETILISAFKRRKGLN